MAVAHGAGFPRCGRECRWDFLPAITAFPSAVSLPTGFPRVIFLFVLSGQTHCTHFVSLHEENNHEQTTFILYGQLFPLGSGYFFKLSPPACKS